MLFPPCFEASRVLDDDSVVDWSENVYAKDILENKNVEASSASYLDLSSRCRVGCLLSDDEARFKEDLKRAVRIRLKILCKDL